MKKLMFGIMALSLAGAVCAEEVSVLANNDTNALQKVRLPRGAKRYGGTIVVPNSQKGVIGVINSQKKVPISQFKEIMESFAKQYKYNVKFIDGAGVSPETASEEMKKAGVQVAVFLTESKDCPLTILTAPESNWSIVNIDAVTKDARNEVFAAARTRKELMRAFMCAAGAMNSQYEGGIMSPVRSPKELDRIVEDLPVDTISRAMEAMRVVGVTPEEVTTYKKACEQGWAPKPTTDYQQVIWDQIHQVPTNGIEIKFDPKKGI